MPIAGSAGARSRVVNTAIAVCSTVAAPERLSSHHRSGVLGHLRQSRGDAIRVRRGGDAIRVRRGGALPGEERTTMTQRILGPTGSRKRKRFLLVPVLLVMLAAVFWIAGAQAVHDDTFFQLDRNAFTSDTSNAATPPGVHDWDQVYDAATYGSPGTTIKSFQTDGTDATIFTGGGSKDTLDIPGWKHKDGSVPDKDNLLHGYAAQYGDNLYFGADRFDGNGTATLGVWFFQSNVAPQSNGTFSGSHVDGDVLVLTDFQSSGANATVRVFRWSVPLLTGCSDNPCLIAGSATSPADCVGPPSVPNGDPYCGTTNSENTDSPWSFTPKVPVGTNIFPVGHFFEGGIDLAALDLGGECFSSFLAETRTSNSVGSQLKDFVTGPLASCGATFATTPSKLTLTLGDTAPTDAAKVTVSGTGTPPAPTGTVSYYLCGPSQTTLTSCDPTGKVAFDTKLLSGAVKSGNEYTVTSSAPTLSGAGNYCFAATWPGDGNYTGPFVDGSSTECFTVNKYLPPTVTSPSSAEIFLGDTITDHIHVTGIAAGGPPSGNVTFFLCSPAQMTAGNATTCSGTLGTAVGGNVALATDTGNVSHATSASATPDAIGTWCWRGIYAGDNNYLGNSDSSAGECFLVKAVTPVVTTGQFYYPNDAATLAVTEGGALAGTVRLRAYTTSD